MTALATHSIDVSSRVNYPPGRAESEPVRIIDHARNLLRFRGRAIRERPSRDLHGAPAREKLHEEMSAPTEESCPTAASKVRMVRTGNEREFPVVTVVERVARFFATGHSARATADLRGIFDGIHRPRGARGSVRRDLSAAVRAAGDAVLRTRPRRSQCRRAH